MCYPKGVRVPQALNQAAWDICVSFFPCFFILIDCIYCL